MEENVLKKIDTYQKYAQMTNTDFGHTKDIMLCIMGMSSCLMKLGIASEKRSKDMINDAVGKLMWYLCNYCSLNNIKLSEIIKDYTMEDIILFTEEFKFEEMIDRYIEEITKSCEVVSEEIIFYLCSIFSFCYPNGTDDSFILLTLNIGITRMRKEYPKKFKLKSVNSENRKYGQE